jgi:hypothetical protein
VQHILILITLPFLTHPTDGPINMTKSKIPTYTTVGPPERSELQQFAQWFHQDWKLFYADFFVGFDIYINTIDENRRFILRNQLRAFLDSYSNDSPQQLNQRWHTLGAEAWQANLDIRETLEKFWVLSGPQQ